LQKDEVVRSPGLKHKHYSPEAKVRLVQGSRFKIQDSRFKVQGSRFKIQDLEKPAFIGLKNPEEEFHLVKICESVEGYAHAVFDFFRECDRENVEIIYCEIVEEKGIGLALMDRLKRASER
jgi:L-threonylcarbamoyladenylate synthase